MSNGSSARRENKSLYFVVVTLPRVIIGVAILVSILINFANIVGRYILLAPIIWAEEIMIYIMVWCVFIGAILVTWEGRHIKMDLLSTAFPSPWKEIVNGLMVLAFVAASIFVILQNWTVTGMMVRLDQRSVVAEIPMSIPHSALLFGFAAMALALVARVRYHVRGEFGSDTEVAVKQVEQTYGIPDDKQAASPEKPL
jgi:TRAP-type C4-dicarboxylate transport system permease small subunit